MSIEEQKAAQAVAWAIQLADGSISPYGWSDMRTFVAAQKFMELDDGCMFVFAYRIPCTHDDVMRLVEAGETFFDAQCALDNHECAGPNATSYAVLMRARNAARSDFEEVLAPFTHQAKDGYR